MKPYLTYNKQIKNNHANKANGGIMFLTFM